MSVNEATLIIVILAPTIVTNWMAVKCRDVFFCFFGRFKKKIYIIYIFLIWTNQWRTSAPYIGLTHFLKWQTGKQQQSKPKLISLLNLTLAASVLPKSGFN